MSGRSAAVSDHTAFFSLIKHINIQLAGLRFLSTKVKKNPEVAHLYSFSRMQSEVHSKLRESNACIYLSYKMKTLLLRYLFIPRRPEKTRKDALIYTEKTRKDALIYTEKTRKDPRRPEKIRKDTRKDPKRHFYC